VSGQQKLLTACIALIPLGMAIVWVGPAFFDETADDAGPGLVMLGGFALSLIGMIGILFCAIIWKWDSPRR
jgi:hypothetical protein